jgi:uncharacterized Fe-S cluster-containing radical SAM superfamily protein
MTPLFEKDGFIICFEALPEHISMRDYFVRECGWTEKEYRSLTRTNPEWFCAKISAWKDMKELGTAYLGCCCYDTYEDFIQNSGYLDQMIDEAIEEAEQL